LSFIPEGPGRPNLEKLHGRSGGDKSSSRGWNPRSDNNQNQLLPRRGYIQNANEHRLYVTPLGFLFFLGSLFVGPMARPKVSDPVGVRFSPKGIDTLAGGVTPGRISTKTNCYPEGVTYKMRMSVDCMSPRWGPIFPEGD